MHQPLFLKKACFAAWAATAWLAAGTPTPTAAATPAARQGGWSAPDCKKVSGAPNITLTRNEGARLARTRGEMAPYSYTYGLTPLEQPDTLLAAVGSQLLRSVDAGCTWQPLSDLTQATGGALLVLAPASGSLAYGWAVNSNAFVTIDGDTAHAALVPGSGVTGLSVSRADAKRLRFGDASGTLWSSRDGGQSWAATKGTGAFVYRTAFGPANPDHVLVGTLSQGAFASFDGGLSWQRATGFAEGKTAVNVFNIVVSPVDEQVVWAMGIDTSEVDAGLPSQGRHLYRSGDGGLHFERVVDQDNRVTLTNGPLMVPHPADPAVLYFVFGTSVMGYGTDLYRYDHNQREVTLTHNGYAEIGAIAFHPRKPKLMYLGLVND